MRTQTRQEWLQDLDRARGFYLMKRTHLYLAYYDECGGNMKKLKKLMERKEYRELDSKVKKLSKQIFDETGRSFL